MSLGKKIVLLFMVLGIGFSIGSFVVLKQAVFPRFKEFETESMQATLSRVDQVLAAELQALEVMTVEYSSWNHTYDYAMGGRPEYAEENLDPAKWQSIDIHMMLVFDVHGTLMYGALQDPESGDSLNIAEEFLRPLTAGHPLVTHETLAHSVSGLLRTRSGIMQVVARPILTGDGHGPVAGSFVIAQFLTAARVADLGKRATADLAFHMVDSTQQDSEVNTLIQEFIGSLQSQLVTAEKETAHGYRSLVDIAGNPVAVIEAQAPRRITRIGARTLFTVALLLVGASAVFLLAAWLFMQRSIVAPLHRLTRQILGIRKTGDLHFEAEANRNDELGVLAGEFGAMTLQLSQVQTKLEKARDEALDIARSKSEFLARMSHEIRTPMNGVLGMTELLRDTPLQPKQLRFTDTIYDSAKSLLGIINDILDYSKLEAGKLRIHLADVYLRKVVEETVESLASQAHRKGIELMTMMPPGLNTRVRVDPLRLRQVLTNLVGNAIKFTDDGEIVVKLTATEADNESLNVLFEVRDTGIGIKHAKHDEIFESFTQEDGTTTRRYGGTGLGLTICRQLIDQMGGDLTVTSTPGKGSVFSFTLTLSTNCLSTAPACEQMHCVAGKRVLVVDDNATNREILEHQLSSWRAHADSASSVARANALLESALAHGKPYDLAILDMHMPNSDGLELARVIRTNPKFDSLKLVILSSVATPLADDVLREFDIAGQLTKPVRQSQLYDALAIVMGGKTIHQRYANLNSASTRRLTGRILLAEDNAVNREVALGMMNILGLEVEIAVNGQEAVDKAAAGSFDAILMDCQMPVMDGFQATKEIRRAQSNGARVPIIAVTANALKGDREQCLAAGMTEYLTKPYTGEQLHAVLALFLQKSADVSPPLQPVDNPTEGTSQAPDSPIDRSTLHQLSCLQQPGAPSIMRRVLKIYLKTSPVIKDRLSNAIETQDSALVRESAHALKSSSMNVGATSLAELCKRLELMGGNNTISDGPTFKNRLEVEYARVVTALQTELGAANG